jgi:hypothetical protein
MPSDTIRAPRPSMGALRATGFALLAAASVAAQFPRPTFAAPMNFFPSGSSNVGGGPVIMADCASGDFNNDGLVDIAAIRVGQRGVLVADCTAAPNPNLAFSAATGATYAAPATITPAAAAAPLGVPFGAFPIDMIATNLNNDGVPDLVVLYRNNGGAGTVVMQPFLGAVGGLTPLAASVTFVGTNAVQNNAQMGVGDFDGDANVDLFIVTTAGGFVFLNNLGTGIFAAPAGVALGAGVPVAMVVQDREGDGDPDVAVLMTGTGGATDNVTIIDNNLGAMGVVSTTPHGVGASLALVGGFLGGSVANGDLIVVGTLAGTDTFEIVFNLGGTYGASGLTQAMPAWNQTCIVGGDLDGDPYTDLVAGGNTGGFTAIYTEGLALPFLAAGFAADPAATSVLAVDLSTDHDGDGIVDVAGAASGNGVNSPLLASRRAFNRAAAWSVADTNTCVVPAGTLVAPPLDFGNPTWTMTYTFAPAANQTVALLVGVPLTAVTTFGSLSASFPVDPACSTMLDPSQITSINSLGVNASGVGTVVSSLPVIPSIRGTQAALQVAVYDIANSRYTTSNSAVTTWGY